MEPELFLLTTQASSKYFKQVYRTQRGTKPKNKVFQNMFSMFYVFLWWAWGFISSIKSKCFFYYFHIKCYDSWGSPRHLWNQAITPKLFQFHAITPKNMSFHDHDSYFFQKKKRLKNIWDKKSWSALFTSWKCCFLNL